MRKKREEEKRRIVYSAGEIIGNEIFEQIDNGQYVIWNMENHSFARALTDEGQLFYETPTTIYYPLTVVPWPTAHLPTKTVEHDELWKQVYEFIYTYVDLPDKLLYDVLTAWVFSTYIREKLRVVPYLFAYGPLSSGKTWLLEVLQKIAYRGIIGSNVTAAALYRGIEKFHPTTFLDETEIYSVAEKSEVIGLLNSGYRKGQYAWRIRNTELGSEIEFFDVFGFKALAGTEKMKDTLESRSIIIRMMKNRRPIPLHIDEEKALDLRNKLLNWRFRKLSDICDISDAFLEHPIGSSNQRIDELFECLFLVANKGKENVLKYAKKLDAEWQSREETSMEAEILECMLKCEDTVENVVLLTEVVAEKFNEERKEKEKWKTRSVGRLISRLGFIPKRQAGSGKRGWFWDKERIEYLKERYRVSSELTSQTSQTPQEPEWVCKFCGKPGRGLYDKIFSGNEEYKAHFECAKQWRRNQGFEEP